LANKRASGITAKLIGKKSALDMLIFCPFLGFGPIKRFEWPYKRVLRKDKQKLLEIIAIIKNDCEDCACLKNFMRQLCAGKERIYKL
jgi:hypothetical protein